MNYLTYIFKAKTVYSVQSPLVYDLCDKVLWTPLSASQLRSLHLSRHDTFPALCYRVANHLQPRHTVLVAEDPSVVNAVRQGCPTSQIVLFPNVPPDSIILMEHPHRHEALWQQLLSLPDRTAAIDIYSAALLFIGWGLSRQEFLLKR